MKFCQECGKELPAGVNACPNCGFIINPEKIAEITASIKESQSSPVLDGSMYTTEQINNKSKSKTPIILAVIAVLLILAIAIGVIVSQNNKRRAEEAAAEAARLEEEQKQKEYEEYVDLFNDTYHLIIENAILVEELGSLQGKVWHNAIWEEDDEETDKYTKVDGVFRDDFNYSLTALFEDEEFISDVQTISDNRQTISSNMGKLKNPPDDLKTEYDVLNNMYNAHNEFVNCVLNPTGKSYQQYRDDFMEKDDNMLNAIYAMDPYVS